MSILKWSASEWEFSQPPLSKYQLTSKLLLPCSGVTMPIVSKIPVALISGVQDTVMSALQHSNTLRVSSIDGGYTLSLKEDEVYKLFSQAIDIYNQKQDAAILKNTFSNLSLEGVSQSDRVVTYLRAAYSLGLPPQLYRGLKKLAEVDEEEFHKEIVGLSQAVFMRYYADPQNEKVIAITLALKKVVVWLDWQRDLDTHPLGNIRRGILWDIEYRCTWDSQSVLTMPYSRSSLQAHERALDYWQVWMDRWESYSFLLYFQYLVDRGEVDQAIVLGEKGWLKTGDPQLLNILFSLELSRGNTQQATQYWLKLSTFSPKVLTDLGASSAVLHQAGLPPAGIVEAAINRSMAIESAYVLPSEERVASSNRENFAQARLEAAYLCNLSTLDGLKERLNALQFPACIHPLGEAMSEFIKTHSLLLLTIPDAQRELYEYYWAHSHESFLIERAMAALRDPDIEDRPKVTLGSTFALPTLIEWSLRNTEPHDLMALHFSALAGYCFFESDIAILEELEKFYDLFALSEANPDESTTQEYMSILSENLQRLEDTISRKRLLSPKLLAFFEESEKLLIESLGESSFRRILASIFANVDDYTPDDLIHEAELRAELASQLDYHLDCRLELYIRMLAVLRIESLQKILSIVGAQAGTIWDDESGRALLEFSLNSFQEVLAQSEYAQIEDLLSDTNFSDIVLHARFFITMTDDEWVSPQQAKVAKTFIKKISALLPSAPAHEIADATICIATLELYLGQESWIERLEQSVDSGNAAALITLGQQAVFSRDPKSARDFYVAYIQKFLAAKEDSPLEFRHTVEALSELMRLAVVRGDRAEFIYYYNLAASEEVIDLDIIEIRAIGSALCEQLEENTSIAYRDMRAEALIYLILHMPEYRSEFVWEQALSGYGVYAMARLDEIDDSLAALGQMETSADRDRLLIDTFSELHTERAVMSYFLLTMTPFYLKEVEDAHANRDDDAEAEPPSSLHILGEESEWEESIYLDAAKSFIDSFAGLLTVHSIYTYLQVSTVLKRLENKDNFFVTAEWELERYIIDQLSLHCKTLCENIPSNDEKWIFLQYAASFFDQYLGSVEWFDKIDALHSEFFEKTPWLIRNQGGGKDDFLESNPFTLTGQTIH